MSAGPDIRREFGCNAVWTCSLILSVGALWTYVVPAPGIMIFCSSVSALLFYLPAQSKTNLRALVKPSISVHQQERGMATYATHHYCLWERSPQKPRIIERCPRAGLDVRHTNTRYHGNTSTSEDVFHLLRHHAIQAIYLRRGARSFAVVVMPGRPTQSPQRRSPRWDHVDREGSAYLALSPVPVCHVRSGAHKAKSPRSDIHITKSISSAHSRSR